MDDTKYCPGCMETKPTGAFHKHRTKGTQSVCKPCKSARDKSYYRSSPERRAAVTAKNARAVDRNRKLVIEHLRKHPCVDCGNTDLRVLEFDHVRGTKILAVSLLTIRPASVQVLLTEIAKCEVRCSNCHSIRTFSGSWRDRY